MLYDIISICVSQSNILNFLLVFIFVSLAAEIMVILPPLPVLLPYCSYELELIVRKGEGLGGGYGHLHLFIIKLQIYAKYYFHRQNWSLVKL